MIYHFASTVYDETASEMAANIMEYEVHKDASWDPFSEVWQVASGGIDFALS